MIMISPSIEYLKKIGKLRDKKYREEFDAFIVEGYKNVLDTVAAVPDRVECIIVTQEFARSKSFDFGREVLVTDSRSFAKVVDTVTPQGVLAVVKRFENRLPSSDRCVLLDRIRDPGNLGTIIRSAAACGYDVATIDSVDLYSPKVVRSCMSAICKTSVCQIKDVAEIKSLGYSIYACDMHGENAFELKSKDERICLVVGNEAEGVSKDIIAAANKIVSLPQKNMESLNAAVAASVLMYVMEFSK